MIIIFLQVFKESSSNYDNYSQIIPRPQHYCFAYVSFSLYPFCDHETCTRALIGCYKSELSQTKAIDEGHRGLNPVPNYLNKEISSPPQLIHLVSRYYKTFKIQNFDGKHVNV